MAGQTINQVARATLAFNRWAKDHLPVANSMMAVDVLIGIFLAERDRAEPATFKELCWDLRHSEQAIRTIVERLRESGWVKLEQDVRFRRSISRLRIEPTRTETLADGLQMLRAMVNGETDPAGAGDRR